MKLDDLPTIGAIQRMLDGHLARVRELLEGGPREAMLSISDASKELKIGRKKVEAMIADETNPLPASKVGRQWRIRRQDLDRYLETNSNRKAS